MVATRGHPKEFADPISPRAAKPLKKQDETPTAFKHSSPKEKRASSSPLRKDQSWYHTPNTFTILWLCLSLPLVIWDTIYVFGRPHTMTGGSLSTPWYTPYELYGSVDKVYGKEAWDEQNGFTAAQAAMNIFETAGYLAYLLVVYQYGKGPWLGGRRLTGGWAGVACLVGFALVVMTASKTILYGLHEVFSGFQHIGHNDVQTIIFLWVLPNSAWIVAPIWIVYIFGRDILRGLSSASGDYDSKPAKAVKFIEGT